MATITPRERLERQWDIFPYEKLTLHKVLVVGVGAVGRQVAHNLVQIGVNNIIIMDPQNVDVENLGPQGFGPEDLDKPKVEVVAAELKRLDPDLNIITHIRRFQRSDSSLDVDVIFCCVDGPPSENREFIFDNMWPTDSVKAFFDSRMSSESARFITVLSDEDAEYYKSTITTQVIEDTCTTKATYPCAAVTGAKLVMNFTKWIREFPVKRDYLYNMLADIILDVEESTSEEE